MASDQLIEKPFEFTEDNVKLLKDKYSNELRDHPDNPIKVCIKLVFDAVLEKDPIRRSGIAFELSKFLTKPDGVINLFLALIDFDTSSQKVTTHNQRFIAVANIISCLPKLCIPYEEYCDSIFKQLFPLLISDNVQYSNLATIIIKSLIDSPHAKDKNVQEIVFNPLLDSLSPSKHTSTPIKPHESLLAIHNLISNRLKIELFVDIFPSLFYSLVLLNDTPSRLKLTLKSCVRTILNGLKPGVACCLLEKTLFHCRHIQNHLIKFSEDTEISVRMVDREPSTGGQDDGSKSIEPIVAVLIPILEEGDDSLKLEFFFKFQDSMWSARDDTCRQLSAFLIEPLLCQSIQEESTKLDLLGIIATNKGKSLELIFRTLLNYVSFLRSKDDNETLATNKLIVQSIGSCFSILEVLSVTLDKVDIDFMRRKCLPVLEEIRVLFTDNGREDEKIYENLVSLIDSLKKSFQNYPQSRKFKPPVNQSDIEFQNIMKDLNDKLVPVRVHALVKLKQMIMTNDSDITRKIPQIFRVVESSLAEDEPYVFLACINLLAEMSVRNTDEILPKLTGSYLKSELGVQVRINIGEVLVRLARQMNQSTPYYAQHILGALFSGCKDSEELLRMSSLTNIGEICRHLGDSLGKYIIEILAIVELVIDNDTIPVKCAGVDLLRTTLMGVDRFTVESIQKELKSMYDLLKKLRHRTLDDKLCLQLDLALDEIDRLAREMLGNFVNQESGLSGDLVKNIKVLSLLK